MSLLQDRELSSRQSGILANADAIRMELARSCAWDTASFSEVAKGLFLHTREGWAAA